MKKFKVEFDFVTTYVGTVEADTVAEAKELVCNGSLSPDTVEPVVGETKIVFIEEVKNGDKKS
tara:strand:+ start:448 stop:636 length:189 start_codon:yes stop_codon:yes gene_type:complete